MEAVWGAVLSFLFVLATLSGYNITGPLTSEQQEQLEKKMKEQKEEFEKEQKEQKDEIEKKQKEKSDKSENKQNMIRLIRVRYRRLQRRRAVFVSRIVRTSGVSATDVVAGTSSLSSRSRPSCLRRA